MTAWYPDPKPNPNWPAGYQPVLLARLGKKDSTKIDGYLSDGGYASWKKVLGGIGPGEWTPVKAWMAYPISVTAAAGPR